MFTFKATKTTRKEIGSISNQYEYQTITNETASNILGYIHGIAVKFKEEYYIGVALERGKYTFEYQVPLFGGNTRRGGTVLDFVVQTPPYITIIRVMGSYWHQTKKLSDALLKQKILKYYSGNAVVEDVDSTNIDTQEKANAWVDDNIA